MSQSHRSTTPLRLACLMLALVLFASACGQQAAAPTATLPLPTETSVPPTNTPLPPTDTPTPLPTDTPTPEPTATATTDVKATQAAKATATMEALVAAAQDVFADYKLTIDRGSLVWAQTKEVSIPLDTYGQKLYTPIDPKAVFSDFIIYTEIGWESTGGLAGCGLMLRSQEDFEKGHQYQFATLRLSGLPAWDLERWQYGKFQSNITGKVRTSPAINQDAGAVNKYLLVLDGKTLTVYGNGSKMGSATESKLSDGRVAFVAFQESGETTCTFNNTWIWALK